MNDLIAINVEELIRIHQPISPKDFELVMGRNERYINFLRTAVQRYLDEGRAKLNKNLKMVLVECQKRD